METKENKNKSLILYIIIAILVIGLGYLLINGTKGLSNSAQKHLENAQKHGDSAKAYIEHYNGRIVKDSALERRYDDLQKIKQTIKIQTDEKIKLVNKYSVSDMQQYFDYRTGKTAKGGNPR